MTLSKRILPIARVSLKNNLPPHLLLCLGLFLGAFLIMWPEYWEADLTTSFFLTFLPLTGLILLTPLFLPEQDEEIADVLRVRATPLSLIFSVRAACAMLFLLALPAAALFLLRLLHCETSSGLWAQAVSASLFLGGLGAFAHALWGNLPAAYLAPVLYFILCGMTGHERMKEWGLEAFCPFPGGEGFVPGFLPALFFGGLLLLCAAVALFSGKRQHRSHSHPARQRQGDQN